MSSTFDSILQSAEQLSSEEQLRLANALYQRQLPTNHDAWLEETRKRMAADKRGEVEWIDQDDAMKRLRAITRK